MTIAIPRASLRGADVREALAGEVPIGRQIVTLCGWCPDKAERTAAARAHGFDVSHGICPACSARLVSEASQ